MATGPRPRRSSRTRATLSSGSSSARAAPRCRAGRAIASAVRALSPVSSGHARCPPRAARRPPPPPPAAARRRRPARRSARRRRPAGPPARRSCPRDSSAASCVVEAVIAQAALVEQAVAAHQHLASVRRGPATPRPGEPRRTSAPAAARSLRARARPRTAGRDRMRGCAPPTAAARRQHLAARAAAARPATSVTSGAPRVSVPVLSKTTARTRPSVLEVRAALDQHAAPRGRGERRHDRDRRRDHQRAGAGDHQQHQRAVGPFGERRRAAASGGSAASASASASTSRRVDAREALHEALARRARGLRLLHAAEDARQRRLRGGAGDAHRRARPRR